MFNLLNDCGWLLKNCTWLDIADLIISILGVLGLFGLGVLGFFLQKLWMATATTSRYVSARSEDLTEWLQDHVFGEAEAKGRISPLPDGWHLVSLHEVKLNTDVNTAFLPYASVSILLTYDPKVPGAWLSASRTEDDSLAGSLKTIDPRLGYFVFDDQKDSDRQYTFEHVDSDIQINITPLVRGWNLVSGWTLVSARENPNDTDINLVFADDDTVKKVVTYKPLSKGRGSWGWVVRQLMNVNSVLCGPAPVETPLLTASRDQNERFTGKLKDIEPELAYWVYKESADLKRKK